MIKKLLIVVAILCVLMAVVVTPVTADNEGRRKPKERQCVTQPAVQNGRFYSYRTVGIAGPFFVSATVLVNKSKHVFVVSFLDTPDNEFFYTRWAAWDSSDGNHGYVLYVYPKLSGAVMRVQVLACFPRK